MRSCLLPVAICFCAAGPALAAGGSAPCDFGLPGDFDNDGDVDSGDFVLFRHCESGARSAVPGTCEYADLDHDGVIGAADFAVWQAHYTGACTCEPILKEPRRRSFEEHGLPFAERLTGTGQGQDFSAALTGDIGGLTAALAAARPPLATQFPDPLDIPDAHPAHVPDDSTLHPVGPYVGDPNPMYGVYGHSGEFHLEVTDLRIRGRGMDVVWTRTYRSRTGPATAMGNGWDFSYNIWIEPAGDHMRLHDGRGRADVLLRQSDGTWSRRELFAVLEKTAGRCTLTWSNGERWQFRPLNDSPSAGRIERMVDRNGNALVFSYDYRGRLAAIHDTLDTASHDRDLVIHYDPDGYIESITDFAGRRVRYEYYSDGDSGGSAGDLRSATSPAVTGTPTGNNFPDGKTVTYTYSRDEIDGRLNHNLLTITDARGQTWLSNTYSGRPDGADELTFDRVIRQNLGGAAIGIDAVYQPVSPSVMNNFSAVTATFNDGAGNVRVFGYDARHRLVLRRDYTGRADPDQPTCLEREENLPAQPLRAYDPAYFETRYRYNEDSLCTRIIHPERNQELYRYDTASADPRSRENLLEHRVLPGPAGGDQDPLVETFEYDPRLNRVSRRVDLRGNDTRYGYDDAGNCTRVQYPIESISHSFEYNAFGQLTARVCPGGDERPRRDEFAYYAAGPQRGYLQSRTLDAGGLEITTTYQYDLLGRVVRRRDPRGQESFYDWNALDQLVRRASPEAVPGTGIRAYCDYIYDASDNLIQIQQGGWGPWPQVAEGAESTISFEYDPLRCLVRRTRRDAGGPSVATEYVYDNNRNLALVRDGEAAAGRQPANTLTVLYDERDLPFRVIRAAGDPLQSSTQYDYDGNARTRRITRGLESLATQVTVLMRDGCGRLVRRVDPMGNEESLSYDPAGNVTARRVDGELNDSPDGSENVRLSETLYEHDAMNRLVRRVEKFFDAQTQAPIDDGEAVTRYQYTDSGLLRRVVDDLGNATSWAYDALGRLTSIKDARGNTRSFSHDASSRVVAMTQADRSDLGRDPDAVFTRTFDYDGMDRLVASADQKGHGPRYTWDALGRCVLVTDARGGQTRYGYDGLGRLIQVVIDMNGEGAEASDAADIALSQRWDDSSRLIAQTDANLNTTSYTYDPLGRLIAARFADGTSRTAVYDVFDRPVVVTDAVGTVIRSSYDRLDRPISRTIARGPGASGVTGESYAYDGLSRLVAGSDDDSAITRHYDSLGHLVRETQAVGPGGAVRTVGAAFNSLGGRLTLAYPGGRVITTSYDALGRPSAVRDETPGASSLIAAYNYLGADRIERCDLGNGVRLDVTYDENRRVSELRYTAIATGALIAGRGYAWDEAGNRVESQSSPALDGESILCFYDPADRLVQSQRSSGVLTINYALDGAGNRITVSGGPDAGAYLLDPGTPEPADLQMNQYTAIPGQPRTYDRSGNLITARSGCRYSYDYRGQLTELTDLSAGLTVLYKYDVLGRRIEKNAAGLITRHYYADDREIEEQNPSNITLATFVPPPPRMRGLGFFENSPVQMTRGNQRYFLLVDDLGSSLALTNARGALIERYGYGDFGQPLFIDPAGSPGSNSIVGNPFLFRGHRFEMESGFYLIAPVLDAGACTFEPLKPGSGWMIPDGLPAGLAARLLIRELRPECLELSTSLPPASLTYDPAAGRLIIRRSAGGPWALTSLGNPYSVWGNSPATP